MIVKEEQRREEEAQEKKRRASKKRKKKDRRPVLYIVRVEKFLSTFSKKYFAFSEKFVLCKFISQKYVSNCNIKIYQRIYTYLFSSYNRNEKEVQLTRS